MPRLNSITLRMERITKPAQFISHGEVFRLEAKVWLVDRLKIFSSVVENHTLSWNTRKQWLMLCMILNVHSNFF